MTVATFAAAEDYRLATAALIAGARAGLDRRTPPRQHVDVAAGYLLLMPAESDDYVGIKLVSAAPGNAARQLPRLQGVYVLLDSATLSTRWVGPAAPLTALRTASLSMAGVDPLVTARNSPIEQACVIGSGPQAAAHLAAIDAIHRPARLAVIARRSDAAESLASEAARALGRPVDTASLVDLQAYDLVVTCTTSSEPLFRAELVADQAIVVAVGSHSPTATELPPGLLARAAVYLEGDGALAEAGDVLVAMAVNPKVAVAATLGELVRGEVAVRGVGPWVFKTVGQGWEDLVVAAAVHGRPGWEGTTPG